MGQGCSCADSNDKEQEVRTDPVSYFFKYKLCYNLETTKDRRKAGCQFGCTSLCHFPIPAAATSPGCPQHSKCPHFAKALLIYTVHILKPVSLT
jgi:hypothetical protein